MKLMPIVLRYSVWTAASVVLAIFAGCAHDPAVTSAAPVAASAASAAAVPPPVATPPSTAAYTGRFVSDCMSVSDQLLYRDVLELTPRDPGGVDVQYTKVFYSNEACTADSLIVSMAQPLARWDLQETVTVDGQKVDRVIITLRAGKLNVKVPPQAKHKVTESDDTITLYLGKDNKDPVPVTRATEASTDKDLLQIKDGKLHMGESQSPKIDGYPSALSKDMVFLKL